MAYSCSAPISASPIYDGLALDLIDHLPESCSSLGSGHAHAHASSSRAAVQPQFAAASPSTLAWDPTPSAPDLFREELFSTLANECNERPTDDAFLAGLQTLSASFAEDQVAELEAVQESDALGTSDRSPSCDSTSERRQESNRQAQKRWRSRQKVRVLSMLHGLQLGDPSASGPSALTTSGAIPNNCFLVARDELKQLRHGLLLQQQSCSG